MQYRVRVLSLGDAQISEQLVDAVDAVAARARLQAEGKTVLSVRRAGFQFVRRTSGARYQYPQFCREIRTLIVAGMTLVEAVETIAARDQVESTGDGLAAALSEKLQQGLSLSAALNALPGVPNVLVAAVRAGERTSNLAASLDDYLGFDVMVVKLRQKIVSASIYPGLVTALGIGISLFLLLVIIPDFSGMYLNLRGSAKGSAVWTVAVSEFIGVHRTPIAVGVVGLAAAGAWWVLSGSARRTINLTSRRLPWLRERVKDFELAMLYQAVTLLLKGGYPMTQALQVAAQAALSPQFQQALGSARSRVEEGMPVSQALWQYRLCDEVGRRLMYAAERNGDFYRVSDVLSRMHADRFERFVERVTRIAEPVLLLAVAVLVGGIVVMMYLPVFDLGMQLR